MKTLDKQVKMPPQRKQKGRKVVTKKSIPPRSVEKKEPETKKEEPKTPETPEKSKIVPRTRRRVNLDTYSEKIDSLIKLLDEEIERKSKEKERGTRSLQRMRKLTRELRKDAPKLANAKRRIRNPSGKRVSGFMIKYPIKEEFANFLGPKWKKGDLLSRKEATNAICVYSHIKPNEERPQMLAWKYLNPEGKRNLQMEGNKMAIKPDAVLSKLLHYDDYVAKVKKGEVTKRVKNRETGEIKEEAQKDSSLYYWVIQKRISMLFDDKAN